MVSVRFGCPILCYIFTKSGLSREQHEQHVCLETFDEAAMPVHVLHEQLLHHNQWRRPVVRLAQGYVFNYSSSGYKGIR